MLNPHKSWRKVKFEDVLELIIDHRGKTPKKVGGDWSLKGIPALSAKNIKQGRVINENDIRYVNKQLYDKWMPIKLEKDDILLTSEAPLGELYYLKEKIDYCLSQRLFALRANKSKLDPKYLYYFLKSSLGQHQLHRRISGTAAEGIRQAELVQIEIDIPEDIPTQRRIAAILSAFDDKIELNNKINQTLEQMAQAIFKEWFVDFRFPGHEKVKMVDSELGKIPEGWEVRTLGEVLELEYGKALKEENRKPGKYPVYGSNGQVGWHNEKLVSGPGIIVGRKGNPGYINWSDDDFYPIDTAFYVVPKKNISMHFIFRILKMQDFEAIAADSAVPGLNRNMAYMNEIVVPQKKILLRFDDLMASFRKTIKNNLEECHELYSSRDLLLLKLMSGEVRA